MAGATVYLLRYLLSLHWPAVVVAVRSEHKFLSDIKGELARTIPHKDITNHFLVLTVHLSSSLFDATLSWALCLDVVFSVET